MKTNNLTDAIEKLEKTDLPVKTEKQASFNRNLPAVRKVALAKRSVKIFKKSNLEEKEYTVGSFKFKCIYTPGHSKDSVTFYFKENNTMFIGDFIFKDSIGRTDLPGGDSKEMEKSIEKIKKYDPTIRIYPGHDEESTLGDEFKNNPFLK